ncbi:hypothetical protein [Methanohalophilus mahii]|uniref:Uncharacterized protein n=1 Tax=Methanohalophilus mahii (strain ATCC 35705 / DSM 5219 / SLP) TaxID=547558 RepID=D5EAU4_METMS|nr:hypothetical protein [Methanohalophilus mahii]ADE36295.1 hypothetical protein Mmah_0771 [Methanohalophilus mahii DSM 5219]
MADSMILRVGETAQGVVCNELLQAEFNMAHLKNTIFQAAMITTPIWWHWMVAKENKINIHKDIKW